MPTDCDHPDGRSNAKSREFRSMAQGFNFHSTTTSRQRRTYRHTNIQILQALRKHTTIAQHCMMCLLMYEIRFPQKKCHSLGRLPPDTLNYVPPWGKRAQSGFSFWCSTLPTQVTYYLLTSRHCDFWTPFSKNLAFTFSKKFWLSKSKDNTRSNLSL